MRILHVIYDDLKNPWLGGGGAVRTFEIYKRLVKKHEITVITGSYPNAKKEHKEGILYERAGSSRGYFLSRLSYSLSAPKLIKKKDHDILIDDFSAYSPCFSPLHTKKTIIASIQNLYSTHAVKKYKFGVIPFLFESRGLKLYQNFILVSPSLEAQLKTRILKEEGSRKSRVTVIPNGVDESLFSLKTSEENYVLFLGRIDVYQKGLDTLLEAFKEVVKHEKKVKLIIVGGGKDDDKLKRMISKTSLDDVDFLGRVSDEKKKQLLSKCLFVCMFSRYEAYGIVAIEVAACGKPVIGTKIPGLRDTIKDGETGILVEPDDSKEAYKAMMRLIEDEHLRKNLGISGRRWAKTFNWDAVAKMQEEFYFKCLKS